MTKSTARTSATPDTTPPEGAAIAPVRKSIRIKAGQAHAFEVFTSGLDRWWPRKASVGTAAMKAMVGVRAAARRPLVRGRH